MRNKTSGLPGGSRLFSPGVRLFRRLNFGAKALLISAVFAVPVLLMGADLVRSTLQQHAFVRDELQGMRISRSLLALIETTAAQRHRAMEAARSGAAPAGAAEAAALYDAQYAGLLKDYRESGNRFVDEQTFKRIPQHLPELPKAPSDPIEPLEIYSQIVLDQLAVLKSVRASSHLTEDAHPLSAGLIQIGLVGVPELNERAAFLLALGMQAMKAAEIAPSHQRMIYDRLPLIEFFESDIQDRMRALAAADPALTERLGKEPPSASELRGLARRYLLGTAVGGDPSRLERAALRTLTNFSALQKSALDAVELALQKRIASIQMQCQVLSGVILVAFALAGYLFWSFYLVTKGGLNLVMSHLQKMAESDLRTLPSPPWGKDEPAHVIRNLRTAGESLQRVICSVRESSSELTATSIQIAGHAIELSKHTGEAAARLEEQASSMKQIGSQVGDTARHAQTAAEFAAQNASFAEKGGEIVGQVVSTMRDIRTSSARISDIIEVINGIAFQTNLLALNAAVEAARAGESGRGFAVVAGEVRGLAQRSSAAAKEIQALVTTSLERVEAGGHAVEEAGRTMETVVNNAGKISRFMEEIVTASREQALGIEQVGRVIQELDANTQRNASLVEKTNTTAIALREQAQQLQQEVAQFKLERTPLIAQTGPELPAAAA